MIGDVKEWKPNRKRVPGQGTRDRCGKLTLTAQNETDAVLLALVYRVIFGVCCEDDSGTCSRLYLYLREQVQDFDEPESLRSLATK